MFLRRLYSGCVYFMYCTPLKLQPSCYETIVWCSISQDRTGSFSFPLQHCEIQYLALTETSVCLPWYLPLRVTTSDPLCTLELEAFRVYFECVWDCKEDEDTCTSLILIAIEWSRHRPVLLINNTLCCSIKIAVSGLFICSALLLYTAVSAIIFYFHERKWMYTNTALFLLCLLVQYFRHNNI